LHSAARRIDTSTPSRSARRIRIGLFAVTEPAGIVQGFDAAPRFLRLQRLGEGLVDRGHCLGRRRVPLMQLAVKLSDVVIAEDVDEVVGGGLDLLKRPLLAAASFCDHSRGPRR